MQSMSPTIANIAVALLAAQKTMGDATKGAKNPFFKSSYADLNAVREAAIPALNGQGISVLQPTVVIDGKNYVNTMLLHVSGEYLSAVTEIKNTKGDAQSEGSGISYARRYGLQSFLNIGAVDDDGESAMGRTNAKDVVKASPAKNPAKVAEAAKPTEAKATTPALGKVEEAAKNIAAAIQKNEEAKATNGTVKKSSFKQEVTVDGDDW